MTATSRVEPAIVEEPVSGAETRTALLAWYDQNGRSLPWRTPQADPYRVWLSEIMLQQTLAAAAAPYFRRFVARWPNVEALAAAPREAVLAAWAGLGYYARARNLHETAKRLAAEGFPDTEEGWRALPGVGAYTAAAIAAIACNTPANVVDGNVERVMARWFAVETPLPEAKARLRTLAAQFVTAERPGDWAQALMDLGAVICTPRAPKCLLCPVARQCRARALGAAERYPRRAAKAAKPRRYGVAFWLERGGRVLLTRRPEKGLLGGMAALPSTPWRDAPWTDEEAMAYAPAAGKWDHLGAVEHTFTHFALTLEVWRRRSFAPLSAPSLHPIEALASAGLPSVFRKAAERARG
jgi:A/G-specific adenine glycosylase